VTDTPFVTTPRRASFNYDGKLKVFARFFPIMRMSFTGRSRIDDVPGLPFHLAD
jgi:hypothetical protein